ncbi:MAG: response regulator [Pseudomonadota bacterium]|nr:response regulator [Pseudomonadota bacterium]
MLGTRQVDVTEREKAAPAKPTLKVFLVEDSVSVRERLIDFLAEPGAVEIVGFAETEAASVAQLALQRVDVAIVDLNLKAGSGFGVISALRGKYPVAPPTIVVLTNYAFPEYEVACRERGADFFFDKSTQFGSVKTLLSELRDQM